MKIEIDGVRHRVNLNGEPTDPYGSCSCISYETALTLLEQLQEHRAAILAGQRRQGEERKIALRAEMTRLEGELADLEGGR